MKRLTGLFVLNLFAITIAMTAHAAVKNYSCDNGAQLNIEYLPSPDGEMSYAERIIVSNSDSDGVYNPMGDGWMFKRGNSSGFLNPGMNLYEVKPSGPVVFPDGSESNCS